MLNPIPNEIITEILTRLPAKSVCRFKCVSKTWESLICNPKFISSYISHNSPSSTSWAIVDRSISYNSNPKQHIINFNFAETPKISSLSVNPNQLAPNSVIITTSKFNSVILTSSNGLFLISVTIGRNPRKEFEKDPTFFLHTTSESLLFVVNPITGKWVPLPKTDKPISQLRSVGFVTRVDSCGVIEKFVVVMYDPIIADVNGILLCFDSDTWKWEELSANYMLRNHFWRADGVFEINQRLFWFDLSCGVITWGMDVFRGVEKGKKAVCRFIPLPNGCMKPFNTPKLELERDIFGSGGCIHFIEWFRKGDCWVKLWRFKDYESCDGEWSLVYNLCRVDVERELVNGSKKCGLMSCFADPFQADIVFFKTEDDIFSYNLRTRKVEKCAKSTGHEYVLPCVLPCWPASLSPRLYATYAKEEGNKYFKDQNFAEATKSYSKGIAVSPNAFTYANRALAYLKLNRFHEAEDDCTKALNLDNEYVKVYGRRAVARKELGDLKGSMEDIESFLKLDPKNEAMKKQLAEIKYLLEKASCLGRSHEGAASDVGMKEKQCNG